MFSKCRHCAEIYEGSFFCCSISCHYQFAKHVYYAGTDEDPPYDLERFRLWMYRFKTPNPTEFEYGMWCITKTRGSKIDGADLVHPNKKVREFSKLRIQNSSEYDGM